MFTGIIQDLGRVIYKSVKQDSIKFTVKPLINDFINDVKAGDSISVNGACMTVEKVRHRNSLLEKSTFGFTAISESLGKTNLGMLKKNDLINLEKSMTLSSKLDGHFVQGHIDTTGIVKKVMLKNDSREFLIELPSKYKDNIIYVGSIAVNGVSLTIADILKEGSKYILIKVAIIPHTFKFTNFQFIKKNSIVNIEFDMIGKYIERIISNKNNKI